MKVLKKQWVNTFPFPHECLVLNKYKDFLNISMLLNKNMLLRGIYIRTSGSEVQKEINISEVQIISFETGLFQNTLNTNLFSVFDISLSFG